jgi:hypothetical protein
MTNPITPPPELVQQWCTEPEYASANQVSKMVSMTQNRLMELCQKSSQYGADHELAACCKVLGERDYMGTGVCGAYLRSARRPNQPTLKEQALAALKDMNLSLDDGHNASIIRRALEALPNE